MAEAAELDPAKNVPLFWAPAVRTSQDDEALREALKRCSARTYEAARQFRRTRDPVHLPAILLGIIEHFTDPDLRVKLKAANDDLRLSEDLGIDSLTRIEIVMLVEEVTDIVTDDKDLVQLKTLGQVTRLVERMANDPRLAKVAS